MSFFDLEILPDDPILSLPIAFAADTKKNKVNLGIGAYRTNEGTPLVLSSVKKAEKQILEKEYNKEYLPIPGDPRLIQESLNLIFGTGKQTDRIFSAQTIGGTGALRTAGEFCTAISESRDIFLSNPSWPNHHLIFQKSGLHVHTYPYYNPTTCYLDISGMYDAIKNMPPKSIILLHGCCHNPTGIDPSFDQWKEISSLIRKRDIIPFFDLAYQGFGKDLDEDAQVVRYFMEQGHEMLLAYSFSKNFGLYGERVGLLVAVAEDREKAKKVASHIKQIIRGAYSTPPLHGARIISTILQTESLKNEWQQELKEMRERIQKMRKSLVDGLQKSGKKDFEFMKNQQGIFSYTGLKNDQVSRLRQEYGLYMLSDGRINVAGLNEYNLDYVIQAINSVL